VSFARVCEYDADELEYWVNVRTTGTLSREDLETLSRTRVHEGEAPADSMDMDEMDMGPGAFETFGKGDMPVEGDATMNESQLHYLQYMSTSYISAAKILNPSHVIPVVLNSFYLGPIEAGHVHEECFEEYISLVWWPLWTS